jgi:hypothetical protein
VERHLEPARWVDRDYLAVRRDGSIRILVDDARARLPLGTHPRAVVVLLGFDSVGQRAPDPFRRGLHVDAVNVIGSGRHSHRSLRVQFEGAHRADNRFRELADPAVVDEPDRYRVQVMPLRAAHLARRQQARLLQHSQVPHYTESRHLRQVAAQLPERLAIALEEAVQQKPATRIAQRPEDQSHRVHVAADYR